MKNAVFIRIQIHQSHSGDINALLQKGSLNFALSADCSRLLCLCDFIAGCPWIDHRRNDAESEQHRNRCFVSRVLQPQSVCQQECSIRDKNSENGLQNKVIHDLIKRLYSLLKINGYDDEYLDDLFYNNVYRINYLTNNKITLDNVEIAVANENELINYINDAKRLIINNERTENIRKVAQSQISGEATEELNRYGIEANIENVQAYLNLKAGRKGRDVSVWDQAEKIAKLAFKETRQKMLEDLIDEEDYEEAYEEKLSDLATQLDDLLSYESETYIDVRSIHLMQKQISVAASLARQNSFEIPVEVDGRVVSMHVTLKESATEGKKVEAELQTQDYGHISMAMTIDDGKVKGAFAAAYPNSGELSEYMTEVRDRFITGLRENEPTLQVSSTDIGIFYRRQEAGSAVEGTENGFFDNRALLRMAELFVHAV